MEVWSLCDSELGRKSKMNPTQPWSCLCPCLYQSELGPSTHSWRVDWSIRIVQLMVKYWVQDIFLRCFPFVHFIEPERRQ